jgi:hypothetical protein
MGRVTASEGVCAVKETSDCERQSGRPDETEAPDLPHETQCKLYFMRVRLNPEPWNPSSTP